MATIQILSSSWNYYNAINVSWTAIPNATNYIITVFNYSDPPISTISNVSFESTATSATFTDTNNPQTLNSQYPFLIAIMAVQGSTLIGTTPDPPITSPPYLLPAYTGLGIPCFPQGSRIAIGPTSFKPVEDLKTGDLVLTADGRQVPATIYSRTIDSASPSTAPYLIPKNSLGPQRPLADLRLSPLHAFQLKKGLWHIPMYAAKQTDQITQYGIGSPITYYHVECPNFFTDNLIMEGGCVVESFGANQTKGIKTLYKYNPGLKGFTRTNALAKSVGQGGL
uniref:Hedgehog/Intein (Hint) domain-containing protein n=1 Tax=viral metagenome TaxID=1070528 RepID=A0A6C0DGG9_9ZZZZ